MLGAGKYFGFVGIEMSLVSLAIVSGPGGVSERGALHSGQHGGIHCNAVHTCTCRIKHSFKDLSQCSTSRASAFSFLYLLIASKTSVTTAVSNA